MAAARQKEASLSDRERAALELTDQIMAYHGVLPEELLERVKEHFTTQEIIALLWQIGSKNAANWFIIAMQIANK
ncbi:carboxymuconolactone decarboxylase family protein [Aneurinibacillus tyrosinisolvens]|uniref:carboxymuconolactone decarboxylase family protein n=1 Tax=Aneurinibacillus tyrosinisolvens TaxID=1443435 RepID=UPI00063FB853|nr:hypothetical protein [Aneurinibacillus tyrosinisolvens]